MTTTTAAIRRPTDVSAWAARLAAGPVEGWITLASVTAMVVALAWSIDDAAWIRSNGAYTDFLAPIGLAGIAAGLLGAKVGWGRWRTHLVGAVIAALVVPIVAGGVMLGPAAPAWTDPTAISARFQAAADVAYRVYVDLFVDGRPFTSQYLHFLVIFGGLVWGTGQFVAYTVFGHRKPLDAVVVTGLALLANMLRNREAPLKIQFMLLRQLRQIWRAKELLGASVPRQEIAAAVGIAPFFLDDVLIPAGRMSTAALERSFKYLYQADRNLKSSRIDPEIQMMRLVRRLTAEAAQRR